jgi:hypothetical protein
LKEFLGLMSKKYRSKDIDLIQTGLLDYDNYTEAFYGLEYETYDDEESEEQREHPFDADKIKIDQQMLSLKYIYDLMTDGKLNLNPEFQRYSVWKERKRKSLLIESLMLRIPIPAFYFYEDENSNFIVIDGQQRLTTIREFINNEFKLFGLEYLKVPCTGKTFSELDSKYQQRIFRTQLAVNIMDVRSPSNVIFDIFRRVNTGGVSLKPQEIRNAIAKNRIREFLKSLYMSSEFQKATRGRVKDDRMDGQELILRFVAFYKAYSYENGLLDYNIGDLSTFLDETLLYLNKASKEELDEYENAFKRAMNNAVILFGQFSFRKCYLNSGSNTVFSNLDIINKALFTSWAVILADTKLQDYDLNIFGKKVLMKLAGELNSNYVYNTCLTQGTGGTKSVQLSFITARSILEEIVYA